jgi:hypothetical protein
MLKKEIVVNHSLDEIRNAITKIATNHAVSFKRLTFDDSFSVIKLWGDVNFGAGVSIEIYYDAIEPSKVKLRIEYVGSGARQDTNESNEASFERDFSKLFSAYLKGDDEKIQTGTGSGAGCMLSGIMLLVSLAAVYYGVCAFIAAS